LRQRKPRDSLLKRLPELKKNVLKKPRNSLLKLLPKPKKSAKKLKRPNVLDWRLKFWLKKNA